MKKLIFAATLTLTATSSFASVCEVDMVDKFSNRLITRIRAYDDFDGCKEGMKACRFEIRKRGMHGRADCVRVDDYRPTPTPNPVPNPYPYPTPMPSPYPGSVDARRMLNHGETVVFNNRTVTIAGISFNGLFAVRSTDSWGTITNNISREQLAVTDGCAVEVCAGDKVIDIMSSRYVKVYGIHFNENFVTRSTDSWGTLYSNVLRSNLARTEGCIASRYAQLCVGDQVINQMNRYSTIAGIQQDGRVVLRSTDSWGTLTVNVEPSSLVVTR